MTEDHQSGYSLLELLIVLALLGLMTLMMSGGIQLGTRTWEKSERTVSELEQVERAQSLLRTVLQRLIPREFDPSEPADPSLFHGTNASMSFWAATPAALHAEGLAQMKLKIIQTAGQFSLTLEWQGVTGGLVASAKLWTSNQHLSFRYATLDQTGGLVWRDDWQGQNGAPHLIGVFAGGTPSSLVAWPPLLIRPRFSRDPSCIYDPVSLSCRRA